MRNLIINHPVIFGYVLLSYLISIPLLYLYLKMILYGISKSNFMLKHLFLNYFKSMAWTKYISKLKLTIAIVFLYILSPIVTAVVTVGIGVWLFPYLLFAARFIWKRKPRQPEPETSFSLEQEELSLDVDFSPPTD